MDEGLGQRLRGRWAPAALAAGWALLVLAWAMANPPFASPDESTHYVRAVGLAGGQLVGDEAPPELAPGGTDKQRAWTRQANRLVEVPDGLPPLPSGCYIEDPNASAACLDDAPADAEGGEVATSVGTYQPLPYLLPAAVVRLEGDPGGADRLARVASALPAVALLAAAALVVWAGTIASLAGLLLAVTPMVLFCAGSLNGSGLEIAAAVAFVAALLRITRGPPTPTHVWALAGVAGVLLALSRSAGPLWVLLALALALALTGPRGGWKLLRDAGRPAVFAGAAVGAAVVANRAWEAVHGPDVHVGFAAFRSVIGDSVDEAARIVPELVGRFGTLEYDLPLAVYVGWFAALAVLLAVALRSSGRRERIVLVAALAAAAVLPVLFHIAFTRHTGFGLQGRHLLPAVVAVPLLAGELVARAQARLTTLEWRLLAVAVPVIAALCQLVAFHANGRRSAVGIDGPLAFLGDAEWSPPLGWLPWLLVAAAGALLVAAPGVAAAGRRPARR